MQSLELNISNHNKQQEKCGELQKISLKCIPLSAGLVSPGDTGLFGGCFAPPVSPGGVLLRRDTSSACQHHWLPGDVPSSTRRGLQELLGEDFTVTTR